MNVRNELTIKIPVNPANAFTTNRSRRSFLKISNQLYDFVKDTLSHEYGINHFDDNKDCHGVSPSRHYFHELIKNSVDSYVLRGQIPGNFLVLKAVVQSKSGKIIVKMKDNGGGFKARPKAEFFAKPQVVFEEKNGKAYMGGARAGLGLFENNLRRLGGRMLLKNRKQEGAAVYMEFTPHPRSSL
ncbi:MAG: hypothetical protein A3F11_10970 [Gammaproteobacteria bacterium RIFCSPHIGHO2_12_FULL_37_14]|nr:MAG: hypothetical protein A3F11_10970 [Gammaproteobacteria bacterium RIFCSPHIGHO2_12_FULL_37_14]